MAERRGRVAIVDYDLGNLFSVQHACQHAGLDAAVTSSSSDIAAADAVILPGVGAFGDAMATLRRLDLVSALRDAALSGRPFLGICLGMQLLMSESSEFGGHAGLGLIPGVVKHLAGAVQQEPRAKIPHVGWNQIRRVSDDRAWAGTLLEDVPDGAFLHFVHSFYVQPSDADRVVAVTDYAGFRFCSALAWHNIFGCQPHPERSGSVGLAVYRNLASVLRHSTAHA